MKTKIVIGLFIGTFFFLIACSDNTSTDQNATDKEALDAYLERGQNITAATFAALSYRLQHALKEGGIPNAIQYCNMVAYPLTDSLSKVHNALIRRTSTKLRNPKNEPTEMERNILEDYEKQLKAGEVLEPVVRQLNEHTTEFFAPIKIQGLCLSCHGKVGQELSAEHYAEIKKYYPADKAIGYQLGDLRGIWSIQFDKAAVVNISVSQLKELLTREDLIRLDVRTPGETAEGKIAGAIEIDFMDDNLFEQEIKKLDPNKPMVVYCQSGKRSARACAIMADKGFTKLYNLEGGYGAWSATGEE